MIYTHNSNVLGDKFRLC